MVVEVEVEEGAPDGVGKRCLKSDALKSAFIRMGDKALEAGDIPRRDILSSGCRAEEGVLDCGFVPDPGRVSTSREVIMEDRLGEAILLSRGESKLGETNAGDRIAWSSFCREREGRRRGGRIDGVERIEVRGETFS